MRDLVMTYFNPAIGQAFLDTLGLVEPFDPGSVRIWACADMRAPKQTPQLRAPDGWDVRQPRLDPAVWMAEWLGPLCPLRLGYLWRHWTTCSLQWLTYLAVEQGVEQALKLDDDTVVLRDPVRLWPAAGKLHTAYQMRSPFYYYRKGVQAHAVEVQALDRVVAASGMFPQDADAHRAWQYNAGQMVLTLDTDFLGCVRRFFTDGFFAERLFRDVLELETGQRKPGTKYHNRSFFDDQRFLSHFLASRAAVLDQRSLVRGGDVYLSKKEREFVRQPYLAFKRAMRGYTILHYVAPDKEPRARQFQAFAEAC